MAFARNLNLKGDEKPTWGFVVLLVTMLALETFGEYIADMLKTKPEIDHVECLATCNMRVAEVGRDVCKCFYEVKK